MAEIKSLEIIDYCQSEHGGIVENLFMEIYPHKSETENRKMNFDENADRFVCCRLAFAEGILIGQGNVFQLAAGGRFANLGYHVHPDFHGKGIGFLLASSCIESAETSGIQGLFVQTESSNAASCRLAAKLGFTASSDEIIEENEKYLKYNHMDDGVCLFMELQS